MEWTNKDFVNLMQIYKERPNLWDLCHEDFKDKNKRHDALIETAIF